MTNNDKRGRGRPIGTGLDDDPTLRKIADMIAANPSLRPTTAIRRALDKPEPSNIRRLQVKWKAGQADYIADAQARRAAPSMPARRASAPYSPRSLRQIAEAQRKMQGMLGLGHDALNDRTLRAIRAAHDNPTMKAIREAHDSPAMRAARELYDHPTVRLMRELQDSPIVRAAREMEKVQRLISGGF